MQTYINEILFHKGMTMEEGSSKFIKVRCDKCKNEQIIFEKMATKVECLICGESGKLLAEPLGGKGKISARVLEVLE